MFEEVVESHPFTSLAWHSDCLCSIHYHTIISMGLESLLIVEVLETMLAEELFALMDSFTKHESIEVLYEDVVFYAIFLDKKKV